MRIANPTAVLGENAACEYLKDKGYKILERNFRQGYGEIDIIAVTGPTLVFVEVKTRSSSLFGTPFEAITQPKLHTVVNTANYYKYVLHPTLPDDIRIDAVGVMIKGEKVISIEHIENISSF